MKHNFADIFRLIGAFDTGSEDLIGQNHTLSSNDSKSEGVSFETSLNFRHLFGNWSVMHISSCVSFEVKTVHSMT